MKSSNLGQLLGQQEALAKCKAVPQPCLHLLTVSRLEFTYKGQTSSLQSSSDIASWIQERKKRFPTAARRAENDARAEKLQQEREQKKEEKRHALEAERLLKRQLRTLEKDKQAATEKAKLKVEKLRRKLEKEERRVAKAEAKSLKRSAPEAESNHSQGVKRKRGQGDLEPEHVDDHPDSLVESQPIGSAQGRSVEVSMAAGSGTVPGANNQPASETQVWEEVEVEHATFVPGPLTPTSQESMPEREHGLGQNEKPATEKSEHQLQARELVDRHETLDTAPLIDEPASGDAASTVSSSMSVSSDDTLNGDEDDETSSSGSSSASHIGSEGPETATSRRVGTRKVPPPARKHKPEKAVCRDFLRTGRCRRGKRCRWRHALPDRGEKKVSEAASSRPERKSLHQRVSVVRVPIGIKHWNLTANSFWNSRRRMKRQRRRRRKSIKMIRRMIPRPRRYKRIRAVYFNRAC